MSQENIRGKRQSSDAGKGDSYRPVDREKWNVNYDKIFGKRPAATGGPDPCLYCGLHDYQCCCSHEED